MLTSSRVAHAAPSTAVGCLPASDLRWLRRQVVEVVSASFDLDMAFIGSSPFTGDLGRTGVVIPGLPTVDQQHRYLARLCGIEIPKGTGVVLLDLRQLATMRALVKGNDGTADCSFPFELEITSPLWTFVDGNISWHVRYQPNAFSAGVTDSAQLPGTDPGFQGLDTSLLYLPPFGPMYTPPGAGIPPGNGVGHLGTFRDMRFPWTQSTKSRDMHVYLRGPGTLVFYASVHQTNIETRCNPPTITDLGAVRPEDRFLLQFPEAIYGRVAGAMLVELIPDMERFVA
jgi:hypothetical protein